MIPAEALAFRNSQSRAVNEFEQKSCADLRKCRICGQFREFLFGEVLLPEELHKALGSLGHGDCFGGILLQNLGTHEVLAKAFERGEVFADACGRELLFNL